MSLIEKEVETAQQPVRKEVNAMQKLLDFLADLDKRGIDYKLDCVRDAIMVVAATPHQH